MDDQQDMNYEQDAPPGGDQGQYAQYDDQYDNQYDDQYAQQQQQQYQEEGAPPQGQYDEGPYREQADDYDPYGSGEPYDPQQQGQGYGGQQTTESEDGVYSPDTGWQSGGGGGVPPYGVFSEWDEEEAPGGGIPGTEGGEEAERGQGDAAAGGELLASDEGSERLKRPSAFCPIHDSYQDLDAARRYLKNTTMEDGTSLWAHTRQVLSRIMFERPPASASFFEDLSLRTRNERSYPRKRFPLDKRYVPQAVKERIHLHIQMATSAPPVDCHWPGGGGGGALTVDATAEESGGGGKGEDVGMPPKETRWQPFMLVNDNMFQFGVGLPREEAMLIHLAMRNLCQDAEIKQIHFWGKIFGRVKNYYILEAEVSEARMNDRVREADEEFRRLALELEEGDEMAGEVDEEAPQVQREERGETRGESPSELPGGQRWPDGPWIEPLPPLWAKPPPAFPAMPIIAPKEKVEVPREATGTGPNKKVFYVTNYPTDDWVTLPDVSPQQIVAARKVRRFFSGNLNAAINTFPPFPGKERNLLRAQIARITAGTHISPMGFYVSPEMAGEGYSSFDEEESEAELEGGGAGRGGKGGQPTRNPHYRPPPLFDLLDETGNSWLHHVENILRQGRTKWWNPQETTAAAATPVEEEEELLGEEDEKPFDPNAPEPEVGPPLLTPIAEDASLEATPPWTLRAGASLMSPMWGAALARSNLWPGAWCVSASGRCDNVYIGFGIKTVAHSFTPPAPGDLQREYPIGPEIMEQTDPTFKEEEEWRKAHEPPPRPPAELMGEGEALYGESAELEDSEEEAEDDD